MKKSPITILLPNELIKDLRSYVPRGKISEFISTAVFEKIKDRKKQLAKDFITASTDTLRKKEFDSWDELIEDGLNDQNNY